MCTFLNLVSVESTTHCCTRLSNSPGAPCWPRICNTPTAHIHNVWCYSSACWKQDNTHTYWFRCLKSSLHPTATHKSPAFIIFFKCYSVTWLDDLCLTVLSLLQKPIWGANLASVVRYIHKNMSWEDCERAFLMWLVLSAHINCTNSPDLLWEMYTFAALMVNMHIYRWRYTFTFSHIYCNTYIFHPVTFDMRHAP